MIANCTVSSFVNILYYMLIAGSVYFVDDKGRCTQCFTAEGPVKFLLYSEGKDMIVVVTEGLILSQHRVAHDGTTSEVAKVSVRKCNIWFSGSRIVVFWESLKLQFWNKLEVRFFVVFFIFIFVINVIRNK